MLNWRQRRMIRHALYKVPGLYRLSYYMRKGSFKGLVTKNDDLVIEGPPRMANTFVISAIRYIQKKKVQIVGKLHSPINVIHAVKKGIPAVILIRDPEESCLSGAIFNGMEPAIAVERALLKYIDFYEPALPYKDKILIAQFKDVVDDVSPLVDQINKRFKLDLDNYSEETPFDKAAIFAHIDKEYVKFGKGVLSERQVSRPSAERNKLKKEYKKHFQSATNKPLLEKAKWLFETYTK